jgi:hypothetical protein
MSQRLQKLVNNFKEIVEELQVQEKLSRIAFIT